MVADARFQPGVAGEERLHPVFVAGEDHDEIAPLALHRLEQDLDRLGTVVALVLGLVEIVGFVDEQHAAGGALDHLFGLGRGVADELAHQIVAGDGYEVALAHVAEAMQDLRPCATLRSSCPSPGRR